MTGMQSNLFHTNPAFPVTTIFRLILTGSTCQQTCVQLDPRSTQVRHMHKGAAKRTIIDICVTAKGD